MKLKVSREFKIGVFGVAMILCLYWGINFLRGKDIFSSNNTYYACYEQVSGVQVSSPVVIKGFKIGTITSMSYDPRRSDKIVLQLNIKSKFLIPDNSTARIFSDGLLGNKAIEIDLGNSTKYLSSGDTLHSFMEKDFMEVAGNEFDFLKERIATVTDKLTTTLDNLNKILSENSGSINTTMTNFAEISGNLNYIVTEEKDDIRDIVANLKSLSATLKENSGNLADIMKNTASFTDSLANSNIPATVENLNKTMGQFNSILAKIDKGEGSVGMLVNDKALYDSLVSASGNLSMLLEDLKANPKRYINVTIFGGKDKSKAK